MTAQCNVHCVYYIVDELNCWYSYLRRNLRRLRVLRSGEDCSIIDNEFPDFIMIENYLDNVMCMEHRLYSIYIR